MSITLSAGVRQNLLSLQNTADLMAQTQNRLATGKKVNSALDNPTNFFTSSSLQARSNDLSSLLDSMSNGIKTLEAADNGLKSITKTLESMQSTLRQARQDKSFQSQSFTLDPSLTSGSLSFSGGAVGETAVEVDLTTTSGGTTTPASSGSMDITFGTAVPSGETATFTVANGAGEEVEITLDDTTGATAASAAAHLSTELASIGITVSEDDGVITLTDSTTGEDSNVVITGANGEATAAGFANGSGTAGSEESTSGGTTVARTVDQLVSLINNNDDLKGKIRASNDNGQLRIENLSTQTLDVGGVTSDGTIDGTSSGAAEIDGNDMRADLVRQFNELRDQLDKLADDASFNGINLLRGDLLKLTFNETGTSTIDIQVEGGEAINSAYLGVFNQEAAAFDSDADIDSLLDTMKGALDTIRSQASSFGSNLSVVQNRTEFTKNMMNTLQTGADNLVLADTNEEAANMLALQTRQQLSSTALSLASQADQAVLRLF